MGLVDYSDSEISDAESTPPSAQPSAAPKAVARPKIASTKVVDRAESGKIRVALPELKPEQSTGPEDTIEAPTAKRPKTSGAFSGFSSLLPPPKNAGKKAGAVSNGASLGLDRGPGLGKGVSLRTGAAPAFSREREPEPVAEVRADPEHEATEDDATDQPAPVELSIQREQPKSIGTPLMFKPLSVARKPQAKKKKKPPSAARSHPHNREMESMVSTVSSSQAKQAKPKVSLFGTAPEAAGAVEGSQPENGYQPLMEETIEELPHEQVDQPSGTQQTQIGGHMPPQSSSNELKSVADSLNLSASERRQLFGRKGQPTDAQIAQFSLAEEYQNNNKMREDESSAPQLNPVKSIAPGKHSLSQLVNAATGQKDALEDAFAQGRRNKREGATRYGWG